MKNALTILLFVCLIPAVNSIAQSKDSLVVAAIIKEATQNSTLKKLIQIKSYPLLPTETIYLLL